MAMPVTEIPMPTGPSETPPPAVAAPAVASTAPAEVPTASAAGVPQLSTADKPLAQEGSLAVSALPAKGRESPVRLFVGGLPPEVDDPDLKKHFSQFGDLLESQVIKERGTGRSRNFGFVMLADSSKQDAVLREPHTIGGRRVSVKLHQDMTPSDSSASGGPEPAASTTGAGAGGGGRGSDPAMRKVFVGRLEQHFTVDMLRDVFTRNFGKVTDVFLATGKKFGFVTFESEMSAKTALDAGTTGVDGVTVVIKSADPMKTDGGRGGGGGRGRDASPPREGSQPGYGSYPYGYGYYGAAPGYPYGYAYPPPGYGSPPSYGYAYGYPPGYSPYGMPGYAYSGYPPPQQQSSSGGGGYGSAPSASSREGRDGYGRPY